MSSKNQQTLDPTEEAQAIQVTKPYDGVAIITIASEPLGVLRHSVKRSLMRVISELEKEDSIRCAVLTGTGKAFTVGSDINDFSQEVGWLLENDYWESTLNRMLETARFPIIAACNGNTLGGGAVLALACDFRVASESAKFGFPEVKVGAFASGSGTQRLPRLVGRGRALELLLSGRLITAQEALQYGLVEFIFPDAILMKETMKIAVTIASYSGSVTAATKKCVNTGLQEGVEIGLALESDLRVKTGRGEDAIEGRAAFLEKRSPKFNRS
ncbi:MAG: enoyl-CoA hydratase/isomerase family protein [Chloroflexi bacterium]|nr:enoyl-CoA hydratase/isomerase family protein [Chloroflexota bacterium]